MRFTSLLTIAALAFFLTSCETTSPIQHVGPQEAGGDLTSTYQLLHPAGRSVSFAGRPIDLVLTPDKKTLFVKDNRGLVVLDALSLQVLQELKFPTNSGPSSHG